MLVVHLALMLLVPVAVGAMVGGVVWLRAVSSAKRAAARQRARLRAQQEGPVRVVEGTLRVAGEPVKRPDLGGPFAVVTAWLSPARGVWSRATHRGDTESAPLLVIEAGERTFEVEESAAVAAGSSVRWTGDRVFSSGGHASAAWSGLRDGDTVLAVGRVSEQPRTKASAKDDYRAGSTRTVMAPARADTAVELAALAPPTVSVSLRMLRTHPAVVLAALVSSYFPLAGLAEFRKTDCAPACNAMGNCAVVPMWADASPLYAVQRIFDRQFVCAATEDAHCRSSEACRERGACSVSEGTCIALGAEDCLHLEACLHHGACVPRDGRCAPGGDSCRHTEACLERGQCTAGPDVCIVGSDADCASSRQCQKDGACGKLDERCAPTQDAHCTDTADCALDGRCSARDGECVTSDASCRARKACLEDGKCTAKGRYCDATERSCAQSLGCAAFHQCRLEEGTVWNRCAGRYATCSSSAACRVHGRCADDGVCSPTSDGDCEASERCKDNGECKRTARACVSSCDASLDCLVNGRCTEKDGRCVVATDADCARSLVCKEDGRCTAREHRCVAGPKDCASHPGCRFHGRCTPHDGFCHLRGTDDCRRTEACENFGTCTYESGCVVGSDDCRNTRACNVLGACAAMGGRCAVSDDADCAKSEVCQRFGWCEARPVSMLMGDEMRCFRGPPTL